MKMKKFLFLMDGFSSDPVTPIDHAIYDLQLLNCKCLIKIFLYLTN